MTLQDWIDWSAKQLAEFSVNLYRQGYDPARIAALNSHNITFRERYELFKQRVDEIMTAMEANPEGYHHFDDMIRAIQHFLQFTCEHRATFLALAPTLAKTA